MSVWKSCRIKAPARLHLGFVDLHGGFGRRFGSIGVTLTEPCLELSARPAPALEVVGEEHDLARRVAERFLRLRQEAGEALPAARLQVHETIPAHHGFGSGTQLALAIAHAFARLHGLTLSNRELMRAMGRGRRSGIGLGAFECGGFICDGGKGQDDFPPPRLARLPMPDPWRVVLIKDTGDTGLQGAVEDDAFEKLPQFSASCAAYLCRVVLMGLLPGIAENDFPSFAAATTRVQDTIGDYFSLVQGGRYASLRVGAALECFRERGIKGLGQSSWGPTGFVFAPDEQRARELIAMAEQFSPPDSGLEFSIARFSNSGASIAQD